MTLVNIDQFRKNPTRLELESNPYGFAPEDFWTPPEETVQWKAAPPPSDVRAFVKPRRKYVDPNGVGYLTLDKPSDLLTLAEVYMDSGDGLSSWGCICLLIASRHPHAEGFPTSVELGPIPVEWEVYRQTRTATAMYFDQPLAA